MILPITVIAVLTGFTSGILLYIGKQYSLMYKKSRLDILLSMLRYTILLTFLYAVLQFYRSDSILLIILFVVSYIGTVLTITTKAK